MEFASASCEGHLIIVVYPTFLSVKCLSNDGFSFEGVDWWSSRDTFFSLCFLSSTNEASITNTLNNTL